MIRNIIFLLVTMPIVLPATLAGFVWGCIERAFSVGRDDLVDDFSDWADKGDL